MRIQIQRNLSTLREVRPLESSENRNPYFRGNPKASMTLSRVEGIRTWWSKGLKRREVKTKKKDLEDLPDSIKCLARCSCSLAAL